MTALQILCGLCGAGLAWISLLIGADILRHRRLARMKREADTFASNAAPSAPNGGMQEERTADRVPHARVEADGASNEHHTGAGVSAGGREPGSGVTMDFLAGKSTGAGVAAMSTTAGSRANPPQDPRRCVRCHHFHLDPDSLICRGCREVMQQLNGVNGRNEKGGAA